MKMITKRTWELPNVIGDILPIEVKTMNVEILNEKTLLLPPGTYKMERIPCPIYLPRNWLVIKGTLIGAEESFLRSWKNGITTNEKNINKPTNFGEFEIIIED